MHALWHMKWNWVLKIQNISIFLKTLEVVITWFLNLFQGSDHWNGLKQQNYINYTVIIQYINHRKISANKDSGLYKKVA